jgi:hypothetical protein
MKDLKGVAANISQIQSAFQSFLSAFLFVNSEMFLMTVHNTRNYCVQCSKRQIFLKTGSVLLPTERMSPTPSSKEGKKKSVSEIVCPFRITGCVQCPKTQ